MGHFINVVAAYLSTARGFVATILALLIGIGIGAALQFNAGFMFGYNLLLSVAAILISGIILVSAARSEAAIHVKLDHLIEVSKATNKAIGLEHKDVREIEKERLAVEELARRELEENVEDEVAEQLKEKA